MNEPGVQDRSQQPGHDANNGSDDGARGSDVDEMGQTEIAPPAEGLSRRQVLVVVLIALLVAGAVVAHLLTGPGVSH